MNLKEIYGKIQSKIYKTYKSSDYLLAWNFFQILKTNDYRLLLKLKDYERLPKIYFDLSKSWTNINNEFLQKTDNQQWSVQLLISEHIERLRCDLFKIQSMCIYLLSGGVKHKKEYEQHLVSFGCKFRDDYEQSIVNFLRSSKAGIEKKIELKKLELKQPDNKQTQSIDDMLGQMDMQLGYHLNLKEISVTQFIALKKALEKRNSKWRTK
jgi:hypothetical protein